MGEGRKSEEEIERRWGAGGGGLVKVLRTEVGEGVELQSESSEIYFDLNSCYT